ncbi:MAG: hypothetical protein B6U75_03700 [Desulfurococcales archaeon ex4484_217_1]|nr:MAG: hypothetical protein B6U75_03700 [Desulfurococcales archaeon ex4484_217_1]
MGIIARAAAMHRVDEIIVYNDRPEALRETKIIVDVLKYLRTPQYLRKKIIPLKKTLKYAGILPPLQTPNHPQQVMLRQGEIREGLIEKLGRKYAQVNVGAKKLVKVKRRENIKVGDIVYVRILDESSFLGEIVDKNSVKYYLCFKISTCSSFKELFKRKWDFKIATSKYGRKVNEVLDLIKKIISRKSKVLIAFGAPKEGLYKIASRHGLNVEKIFDIVINTIPYQGIQVIRTEEAIHATLELISLLEASSANLV